MAARTSNLVPPAVCLAALLGVLVATAVAQGQPWGSAHRWPADGADSPAGGRLAQIYDTLPPTRARLARYYESLPPSRETLTPYDDAEPPPHSFDGSDYPPPGMPWLTGQSDCPTGAETWYWQLLPDGLIYHSYLAGSKEPRFSGIWAHEQHRGWLLDVTLGGRMGILRYGTPDPRRPQGWQLDIEGAAFPRINLEEQWDLDSSDFRFGVPVTYGWGDYQMKLAGYPLSSHLGDEYLVKHPTAQRINFSRDVLVWGHSWFVADAVRVYGEVGWAYQNDGGSRPWEFQFGVEYSPRVATGALGSPFAAVNAHLRQEVNYGGEFTVQAGWQWRGDRSGHLLRWGLQYFNGQTAQYQFYRDSEQYAAIGLWYDY